MKDQILKRITQEDIYARYFPDEIALQTRYCNPTRIDKNPDCYFTYINDRLMFVDFGGDPTHMDCFRFIQEYFDISFYEVLTIISKDFGLGLHKIESLDEEIVTPQTRKKLVLNKPTQVEKETVIKVVNQPFQRADLDYWAQFGISLETLVNYNVRAVYRAWINGDFYHEYKAYDPMYRYKEQDKFKLYRPLADKRYKWRTNMSGGVLEGWSQLPDKGNLLIVTKSRKDVMTLHELGYAAVAVRSESSPVSENAAALLNQRFGKIILWFDNDKAGIKYSDKLSDKYGWETISFPTGFPKDPSDYVKDYGQTELLNFIKNIYE